MSTDVDNSTAPGTEPSPSAPRIWDRGVGLVGRAPALTAGVIGLIGLLIQTIGYAAGWNGYAFLPIVLFYIGLAVLVLPYAVLLLSAAPAPRSRFVAAVSFGLLMYASWVAAWSVYAGAFDETLHVTTLVDLNEGAGWFAPNEMLPVSPHYPGIELAATTVHWLTGLPLMACQVIVVALARTVLVVALFLLGSRVTRSARGGGIVVLLYAASPQFWFFNAQFSYQTLALALLASAIIFQLRAFTSTPDAERYRDSAWPSMIGVQVCMAALAVTHHLTSWVTVVALWVVALVLAIYGEPRRARLAAVSAQLSLLLVVAWSALIAPLLGRYLGPVISDAGGDFIQLIKFEGAERQLVTESADNAAPLWENGVMALSILIWLALLVPSLRAAVAGRTLGRSPVRFVVVALAAVFPVLFALRFSSKAAEIADRSSTFVTLGVALVVAAWLVTRPRLLRGRGLAVGVAATMVLMVGGLILGSGPDWQRVPGPYVSGAEQRSIDSETIAVADWAGRYLPEGSRIAADNTMNRVITTVAPVEPVTSASESVNVSPLFVNPTLDFEARQLLIRGEVDFVVVDYRMVGQTVRSGSYFEGSNGWGEPARTLTAAQLDKFDGAPGFELVLDGPVKIYDVRSLRSEPQEFADRAPPGAPGTWSLPRSIVAGVVAVLLAGFLLVRRRRGPWRPEHALPLLVTLPVFVGIGALGVTLGLPTLGGVVVGVLVVVAIAAFLLRSTEPCPRWWRRLPGVVVVGVLLAVIVTLSTTSAWNALFDTDELPPPTTTTTQAGS